MGQYPYCPSRPTAKQRAEQYIAHQHKTLSVVEHTMQNVLQLTHTPSAKQAVITLTKCKGAVGPCTVQHPGCREWTQ
jgi:hypothetical protein